MTGDQTSFIWPHVPGSNLNFSAPYQYELELADEMTLNGATSDSNELDNQALSFGDIEGRVQTTSRWPPSRYQASSLDLRQAAELCSPNEFFETSRNWSPQAASTYLGQNLTQFHLVEPSSDDQLSLRTSEWLRAFSLDPQKAQPQVRPPSSSCAWASTVGLEQAEQAIHWTLPYTNPTANSLLISDDHHDQYPRLDSVSTSSRPYFGHQSADNKSKYQTGWQNHKHGQLKLRPRQLQLQQQPPKQPQTSRVERHLSWLEQPELWPNSQTNEIGNPKITGSSLPPSPLAHVHDKWAPQDMVSSRLSRLRGWQTCDMSIETDQNNHNSNSNLFNRRMGPNSPNTRPESQRLEHASLPTTKHGLSRYHGRINWPPIDSTRYGPQASNRNILEAAPATTKHPQISRLDPIRGSDHLDRDECSCCRYSGLNSPYDSDLQDREGSISLITSQVRELMPIEVAEKVSWIDLLEFDGQ